MFLYGDNISDSSPSHSQKQTEDSRVDADTDVDADADGQIDDAHVLELLEPSVRDWWVDEFGEYTDINNGYFTPPQKEAVPLIHEGENALIASPTGSGKCVTPDTPLLVDEDGESRVLRASDLLDKTETKVADVDHDGELHTSSISSYSLTDDGEIETKDALVYSETYSGDVYRLKTVYGREVELTPDHPLLVETRDGSEWRRAEEVDEGDRIGVPRRIDLPEETQTPHLETAVRKLRQRFEDAVTSDESESLKIRLREADGVSDLSEKDLRRLLCLARLTITEAAETLSVSPATVHRRVTSPESFDDDDLGLLRLIEERFEPLGETEVAVVMNNGAVSRFEYPETVDAEVARLAAFVLAEGFIGDYDRSGMVSVSQSKRTDLLEEVRRTAEERFGVVFELKEGSSKDYAVNDSAFAVFFSELLDIDTGEGREVDLPDWILNAPRDVKRAFVSTFLSLEAEVRNDEVRLTQANEMKIEQINYLLMSFGILASRRTVSKRATNSGMEKREYTTLTVRRKQSLRRLVSEFDIRHPNTASAERHAVGDGSGYITQRGLDKLDSALDSPPDGTDPDLEETVGEMRDSNVVWLEVTEKETVDYDGEIIDLNVPDLHNFVGGSGGMYLHNTLASFTSIINELFRKSKEDELENSVYCLYVSPLKSLANDIHRNLEVPLEGIDEVARENGHDPAEIRHAIRHGDTSDYERQKMLDETPHILNTTPETLGILLNSPKFREKLRTVEYVIVDEIHSLADNKRGVHLSVSLERLENLCETSPTRIGCSATVEPLEDIADFLVGYDEAGGEPRDSTVVDTRFVRDFDIQLRCPTDDLIHTPNDEIQDAFYQQLHSMVQDHDNTLIFTNTRSGAERVLHNLRDRFDVYDDSNSGCHHGSVGKEGRKQIEEDLKSGDIDFVTSSTSLELGVDMPHLDLVVQVGSPKSVAGLLQRIGRAGHSLGETVEGRVIALDRDELVECAVMLKKAEEGFVDRVFVPEKPQDVLAQHVYGMAINSVRPEREVVETVRRAYPYRNYKRDDWESLMRYLTADYEGMEDRSIYAKVWRDENDDGTTVIGKRGKMARVIYMTNIGTIPDSFTIDVFVRGTDEWVGDLDEGYLDNLDKGDVFVLGGQNYEFKYRRGSKVYVDPTTASPTVPSWFSERLPLSYDLGREILRFKRQTVERLHDEDADARDWLSSYPIDPNSVESILRIFDEQLRYASELSVSTDERFVVEQVVDTDAGRRHYYFHSNYGRKFNDGLSRIVAHEASRRIETNVKISVADNGFAVSMPMNRKIDVYDVIDSVNPDNAEEILRDALDGSELLKRYFRINATRSLMILKNYKGNTKSAKRQQVSSDMLIHYAEDLDGFVVLEETYREVTEDKLDIDHIQDILGEIHDGDVDVVGIEPESPTPMAFGIASLAASDVVLAEDKSKVLEEFHDRVMEEID
ncbi:MAG: ATP-dependent helicase [Halobacteria archaeon]|nr:ATP-dependent helicase [Halobacteria archaeon]